MAGYNGFSMSNNATYAYEKGLCPASKIKGIPASLINEYCYPSEWHHSSKNYNKVNFYDPDDVRKTFNNNPDAILALQNYKNNMKNSGTVYENSTVQWIRWEGSLKHPKAVICNAKGCKVIVKGLSATVTLPYGNSFIKRLSTKGFIFSKNTLDN
jgi:hypothetical protein